MSDDPGTLHEVGERWMLRFERVYDHSPARVWRMITEPDGLAHWFPARVAYDALEVGAAMTFTFSEADLDRAADAGVEDVPEVSAGVVRELVRERVFAFEWLDEPIRFELQPLGEHGCRLVFTHSFAPDAAQTPRNATGWHVCLEALAAALAGVAPPPQEARQAELEAIYGRELLAALA